MTKMNLIIPICVTIVSGCAILDGSDVETDKPILSAPVIDKETSLEPAVVVAQEPVVVARATPAAPRKLGPDEIRRLQTRLREIGFDPGPVDGVAGQRTRRAFERLQSGCANAAPVVEKVSAAGTAPRTGNAKYAFPTRPETLALQTQLRAAGFDPGPADGIFGNRTKAALVQLQTGCLLAKEFDGSLNDGVYTVNNSAAVGAPTETANASAKTQPSDAQPAEGAAQLSEPQEEIRILQLRLRDAGFDPGPFDGVMGPKTRLALEQYEASQSGKKIKTSLWTKAISGQY